MARALLEKKEWITSGDLAQATGLTRQAAHRHLSQLVDAGEISREGAGRGARYRRRVSRVELIRRRAGLDESKVWEELQESLPEIAMLPRNVQPILHYVVTELVNNAIEHSEGRRVRASLDLQTAVINGTVVDDGVGAFARVRRAFELASDLEALQELSKGKTTTDPEHHTGEGLFFCSKVVDFFELESGTLRWSVDNEREDVAVASSSGVRGTRVSFELSRKSTRTLRQVFEAYTEDLAFTRTRTVVRLFSLGVRFMSRSEARRLLHGLDKFAEVVLDFAGVEGVGQGFADEVFRVWARAHPNTRLSPVNMGDAVEFMVRRALTSARER